MIVTVTQIKNEITSFDEQWKQLISHVKNQSSELVLLPEMPFYPWLSWTDQYDPAIWINSVKAHERWIERLHELSPAVVFGTIPVCSGKKRYNEGFIWDSKNGYRPVHRKYYLPNEKNYWEATWYDKGDNEFTPVTYQHFSSGFLICTEMWFMELARAYGKQGIHIIMVPRATPLHTVQKWIAGGKAASVVSGAYCLSSCLSGKSPGGYEFAGTGWIIHPEEGEILSLTSDESPFTSANIHLEDADKAKKTYPRYIQDC